MRAFFVVCLFCGLFGCTPAQLHLGSANANPTTKTAALQKAEKLMRLAEQAPGNEAVSYKLQAVEQLIAADQIEQAEYAIHEEFKKLNLDQANAAHKQIILAQIDLAKQNLNEAKQHLRGIWTPAKLPEPLLIKFYQTRAEIYRRSGSLLDAVQERVYLGRHLKTPEAQAENNHAIWDILVQLTPNALQTMPRDNLHPELNGWLEFATISKQYDVSSEQLLHALNQWHTKFPQHPAMQMMPQYAANVRLEQNESKRVINAPKKIAVMLPLQGTHAKSAQAVRDGFLAAFYAHKDGPNKPSIQVYDTSAENILTLYNHIIEQGTDFIVGPLTKDEVDAISGNLSSKVPMLALNSSNKTSGHDNILQFSLAPELEAQAVARKAWHDGHRSAVVIIPKSAWGKRMYSAFEKTWTAHGGTIIAVSEVSAQADLTSGVKKLLAIDASEARAQKLKQSGLKFAFDPRRRQDIDMVFIATNPALARQVKPLLNFYFAGNLPAYASSSIYSGRAQPTLDQDLNGIQFCDMPWILDEAIQKHGQAMSDQGAMHGDFEHYARLYALGLDAYKVALQIEQLTAMPNLGISGMTGMLTLDNQQVIDRKLTWAAFKKGSPQISGEQF